MGHIKFWNKLPEQIKHLLVPCVIIIGGAVIARLFLVPPDFGLWGHYRASSVLQIADQKRNYAGSQACAECHDAEVAIKKTGYHNSVACETCHGPAAAHAEDPDKIKPVVPKLRSHCLLCHEYLPSRPTGFPQIVSESHNPVKPCITCHQPHDPKPPHVPKGCDACHAKIQRTISVSHHAAMKCTECHETDAKHNISPRAYPPNKLQSRESCGKCHSQDASAVSDAPKINMANHGEKYLCWECHSPHMPEAH